MLVLICAVVVLYEVGQESAVPRVEGPKPAYDARFNTCCSKWVLRYCTVVSHSI